MNRFVKPSSLVDVTLHLYQTTRRDVIECSIVTVMTAGPSGRAFSWLGGIAGSNPAGSMDVSLFGECCALLGGGLCAGPITLTEESYRVWRV